MWSYPRRYLPRRNKSYIVLTIRKRYKEQQVFYHPNSMVACFFIETCSVFLCNMIRIIKDPRCIVERDTVFGKIFCRFA